MQGNSAIAVDERVTPLDVPGIVAAARGIVEREGLDKLTMRRLGRELDVEAMSIYHHVPNKAALLDLLVQEMLHPLDDLTPTLTAYDAVGSFARQLRRHFVAHAELAQLVATRDPASLLELSAAADVVERLNRSGFDPVAARWILESFVGFVAGHSLVAIDGNSADDDAAFETGLRFMLAGLQAELGDE